MTSQLQSLDRPLRHPADRLGDLGAARRHQAGAAGAHRHCRHRPAGPDRRRDAEHPRRARRVRRGGGSRRCAAGGHQRRHAPGVRLSRRRPGAVRDGAARDQLHPGVPGAAADPGDQRARQAALSLGHPATGRRRHRLGAAALARRHRPGRHLGCRQRVRRHGRGAAAGAAVPRHHEPRRTVRDDDGRHGRRRRHGAGDLRHPIGADAAGRRGAPDRRLRHQRAGRTDAGRADGAGRGRTGQDRGRHRHHPRRPAALEHGRHRPGHARGHRAAWSMSRPC